MYEKWALIMIEDLSTLLYLTHYNQNINIGFPEEKVKD